MPKVNETFTVEGLDSLRKVFERLPPVVAQRVARRALYRGAIPIRDAARSKVSIRYGALKRAIIVQTGQELAEAGIGARINADGTSTNYTRYARTGNLKVYVTIAKKYYTQTVTKSGKVRARALRKDENYASPTTRRIYPRRYAHLVEFGTAPHSTARGAGKRSKKRSRRDEVRGGHLHPGAKPKPFMRPAFDEQSENAINIIAQEAGKQLSAELVKLTNASKKSTK